MAKIRRDLLDKKTGFNIMVNLYILRYLYSHMTNKATDYMVTDSERKKSKDFFEHFPISCQRMNRILHGENFKMPPDDTKAFANYFNVPEEYFQKHGKIIEIHGLEESDWRVFFEKAYGVSLDKTMSWKDKVVLIVKVKKALEGVTYNDAIEKEYGTGEALFRIYYRFKNNQDYRRKSPVEKLLNDFGELQFDDWKEIEHDIEKMELYRSVLMKHAEYLRIVIEYKKIKK